jgi:hypothetical protein
MNKLCLIVLATIMLYPPGSIAASLSADGFSFHKVIVRDAIYDGKKGVQVEEPTSPMNGEDRLAIFKGVNFQDGEIEGWISGAPKKGAFAGARGFVGIAFRIAKDRSKFEAIYLRPTNARSDNQLQRNHSIQYFSYPAHPWHRLRRESPAKYEAYADMEPGQWIKYRLVVKGSSASLYLGQNSQPSLIVNDLKLGSNDGGVGLWIGPGTTAYFSELKVRKR